MNDETRLRKLEAKLTLLTEAIIDNAVPMAALNILTPFMLASLAPTRLQLAEKLKLIEDEDLRARAEEWIDEQLLAVSLLRGG